MASTRSMTKYLASYAEPEVKVVGSLEGRWAGVVVVPICDERVEFIDGLASALRAIPCLLIVIVNARQDARQGVVAANASTLEGLRKRARSVARLSSEPPMALLDMDGFQLLLVDRSSAGNALPSGQGVGLARRIGCDIALALQQRGAIKSPWIHTTDADVELPAEYLSAVTSRPKEEVALTYPFVHVRAPGPAGDALALYDMSLRYYVCGLQWAGSRWAFHSVGSTLAFRGEAYAKVRGMPRRQAAEDFYMLAKLAKLGEVGTPTSAPIRIHHRDSERVPFGTGRATSDITAALRRGEPFTLYDPISFVLLRRFLEHWRGARLDHVARGLARAQAAALNAAIVRVGAVGALAKARRQVTSPEVLSRRLDEWFDSFRTMMFLHAIRDHGFEKRPWREALEDAPFALPDDLQPLRGKGEQAS